MGKIVVDGIEIDPEIWIDANVSKFLDAGEPWVVRQEKLAREIAIYEESLRIFEVQVPKDPAGEAHVKAYLAALRQAESVLWDEFRHNSSPQEPNTD